jgi:enamine deaminase RidA (YjgF/YER057c/UK114 family)
MIEAKLKAMGLTLPAAPKLPANGIPHFSWVRVYEERVFVSGHAAQNEDGSFAGPIGKVGADISFEQAHQAARLTALSVLASLKRAIGDLDRVSAWLNVSGMVNVAPGFANTTGVIDGFSDLILEIYGPEIGRHARTAVGLAQLPLGSAVVVAAELALFPGGNVESET